MQDSNDLKLESPAVKVLPHPSSTGIHQPHSLPAFPLATISLVPSGPSSFSLYTEFIVLVPNPSFRATCHS